MCPIPAGNLSQRATPEAVARMITFLPTTAKGSYFRPYTMACGSRQTQEAGWAPACPGSLGHQHRGQAPSPSPRGGTLWPPCNRKVRVLSLRGNGKGEVGEGPGRVSRVDTYPEGGIACPCGRPPCARCGRRASTGPSCARKAGLCRDSRATRPACHVPWCSEKEEAWCGRHRRPAT